MKTIHAFTLCAIVALFSGCANGPPVKITAAQGAMIEKIGIMAGLAPVLNNNPKYIPAAEALAFGINAALTNNPTITPQLISDYVFRVCKQNGVSESDIPIFETLTQTIYEAYIVSFQPTVISSTDPNAILYINAFRDGMLAAASIARNRK